jgi:hypothetical protein
MRPAHQTKWISLAGRLEHPSREMRPKTRDAPERCRGFEYAIVLIQFALFNLPRQAFKGSIKAEFMVLFKGAAREFFSRSAPYCL